MFRLESNAEGVFLNFLRDVDDTELDLPDLLRAGAVDALALISNRIQQRGQAASGRQLETKAKLRGGAYSAGYAKRRAERGRQINRVDLTNSGDLMRNLQVISVGDRLVTAGFLSDEQAHIADALEDYYGEPIIELSDSEQETVADGIAERVLDKLEAQR